jgi:hypothetical protein
MRRWVYFQTNIADSYYAVWVFSQGTGRLYYRLQVNDLMVSPVFATADEAVAMIRSLTEEAA